MNTKKSNTMTFLEDITGGVLTLSELLMSIRLAEGLSQVDFAKKLKISRSHLCDIEKRRKFLSVERACAFAVMLGYSKEQFVRLALQEQLEEASLNYKIILEAA